MKAKWKTTLKILLGVIGTLLLLIILTVLFWLGPTVKLIAQNVGEDALGTPLSIDKLTINPRKGIIQLSDFSIANPESFGKSNVVSLASMDISIDMGSLLSPTTVVHKVSLNSPFLIYEQAEASDNIREIIANIQEFMGYDPDAEPDPKKLRKKQRREERRAQKKKDKGPKVVIIESMEINDAQFLLAHTYDDQLDFGVGIDRMALSMTNGSVRLDNFHITNPGRLETSNLFSVGQFEVLLEPGTIYSTNLTIHAVNIHKPHLFVEHNPETDTLGEFLKIASGLAAKFPDNASKKGDTGNNSDAVATPSQEVALGDVRIGGTQLHFVNIGDPELDMHLGIEQISAALDKGRFELENLFITNPHRLATTNLFSLKGISAEIDPAFLKGETPNVRSVQVDQPYLFLELNNEANTISELMKIANGFTERLPAKTTPEAPRTPPVSAIPVDTKTPAPPVQLHSLLVDDIQVKLLDSTSTNNPPDQPRMLAGIGEISVKLVDGKLQVKGITVPNTPGFTATNLFHLANIDIELNPESVFSDQLEINSIFVNSPAVNLEQTEESGNVLDLQTQLMNFAPPAAEGTEAHPEGPPAIVKLAEEKPEPVPLAEQPVVLHQLLVTNLSINTQLHIQTDETPDSKSRLNRIKKLNPMDKIPFDRINPLADNEPEEEIDPDAPVDLISFRHLSAEPLKGLVKVKDLRVSNPPGFSNYDMVHMTELRVDINTDSMLTDTLVIEDILVDRPRIVYERKLTRDNIKTLREEILNAVARRGENLEKEKSETPQEKKEDGQKLIINHLLVQKGTVKAKLSVVPTPSIPLPAIEISGIGQDKGGASLEEVDRTLYNSFYNAVLGAVSGATGFATDALKGAGTLSLNMLGLGADDENAEKAESEKAEQPEEKKTSKPRRRRRIGGRLGPAR